MKSLLEGANVIRLVGILWDDNAPDDGSVLTSSALDAPSGEAYRVEDSDCLSNAPPYITEACLAKIDWALRQATDAGVWAILTVRGKFAAGQDPSNDVFNNATLREMLFSAWEHVATRYADFDGIAAYEIMSEPRDKGVTPQQVHDFYAEGCARVHAVDKATPCMVGPSRYYKLWEFGPAVLLQNDSNVIYTFDYFQPAAFSAGEDSVPRYPGVYACSALFPGWVDQLCPQGAASNVSFDANWSRANLAHYALPVRAASDVPLFINQWAVVHGVSAAQGRYAFMDDFSALLQQLGIGWTWWVFRGGGADTWAHGSSEFVYQQANGTRLLDTAAFDAVRQHMSDIDGAAAVAAATATAAATMTTTRGSGPAERRGAAKPLPPKWPMSGITFTGGRYCPNVTMGSREGLASLEHLASTGASWVSLVVTSYQHSINTTTIFPLYNASEVPAEYYVYVTISDDDLLAAIRHAHALGLKVMLKPHLDPLTDNAPIGKTWRGQIGSFFGEEQWAEWFESYWGMLGRYAAMAEREGVEMLSMNCELIAANNQSARWRDLVKRARAVFSGLLTTAPNGHGHEFWVDWWDAVDVIGVDFYDPIAGSTLAEMAAAWAPVLARFERMSRRWGRPLVFTEIGYCSGACDRSHAASPLDLETQARHYEALLLASEGSAGWLLGAFWWNWVTDDAYGAADDCLNPEWKPAEEVLRRYYRAQRPRPPKPAYLPRCVGRGTCTK